LLQDHLEGRTDYQLQLFLLASLELWFRVFIDAVNLESPSTSLETSLTEFPLVPK
jgi:asparagine synthase (glutamine-hydrolysing)